MTGERSDLLDDLAARGLVHDHTDLTALGARLADGPVAAYYGCDPTADSLHAGNLIGLLVLRRLQLAGHRPVALAGGATGMIGDPSGRSEERTLLDEATLARNVEAITEQVGRFVDFEPGPFQARLVDNRSWTAPLTVLEFLRDIGKHVTVNQMVAKESVRSRMEAASGISFTEFSYMLLQANDYLWLHDHLGVELQIGGSDQWGNITAGIDLVRRRSHHGVHGLTWPLLTRADGTKFGKSMGENIWLSAARTSPYRFFQHWMQVDDRDLPLLLAQLTLLPVEEVQAVALEHAGVPERRVGQRRLAAEVTGLVHGPAVAAAAERASAVLFDGGSDDLDEATFEILAMEVPTVTVDRSAVFPASGAAADPVDLLVAAGLASSRGDARRTLVQGGAYANGTRLVEGATVSESDLRHGRHLLLRKGKRSHALVVVRG